MKIHSLNLKAYFRLQQSFFLTGFALCNLNFATADNAHLSAVNLTKSFDKTNSFKRQNSENLENLSPADKAKKLNEIGVELVLRTQIDEGLAAFQKGETLDPLNSTIHYNLAGVYLNRGDIEAALIEAKKCVELRANDLSFLHRLGEIYFAEKNYAEAAKLFEQVASQNPEFNEVIFHLGTVYAMQGRWTQAEAALRRAREIYPAHSSVEANLANVLIMTQKFSEAASILEKVNKLHPSPEVSLALGIALEGANEPTKALQAFQTAKELGSKDSQLDSRVEEIKKRLKN